jgi:streptogramin lyase
LGIGKRLAALLAAAAFAAAAASTAVALGTGRITEFPIPTVDSQPPRIAAGSDGSLWFTESRSNEIGRITPAGAISEFNVPQGCCVNGIAAGPGGNLWFTEGGALVARIGRITPAGVISEFTLPSAHYAQSIAAGADGNLWFAETPGNRIGRITPSGVLTEFPIPTPKGHPRGIAAGPDGALWFTEIDGNKIGRITLAGEISEFAIPTASSDPWGIAAGPDGNLWFTESLVGKVGRITPAGGITEFTVPNGRPQGIVAGPDGNLWFSNGTIGRITPAGIYSEFGKTLTGAPLGITAGPDGNLWFTEFNAGAIGRLKAAESGRRYVLALASGFVPASRAAAQGETVQWSFYGPNARSATDSSGMNLFSGARSPVSYSSFAFSAAGVYPYADTLDPVSTGTIKVPALVSPASGTTTTTFTVTWASAPPAVGFVSDVQIRRPGAGSFTKWMTGQTGTNASFVPDAGTGSYSFRARLRKQEDFTVSGWSPAATITVS